MLRVAVPNKGTLSEPAAEILSEAGYRRRTDQKDLTVIDPVNNVEFFFLRPKDIAIYVGSGQLDFGITGRDLAAESDAPGPRTAGAGLRLVDASATQRLRAGTGRSGTLRASGSPPHFPIWSEKTWRREGLMPPSFASTVRWRSPSSSAWPTRSPTSSAPGRTLGLHDLVAFGEPLCDSEAVLIETRTPATTTPRPATSWPARVQGVVFGQQYLMLDYDCPRTVLDAATAVTPGLESPTIAPLADPAWVAVRALVPRRDVNAIMDELAAIGAKAILASDIRFCRF